MQRRTGAQKKKKRGGLLVPALVLAALTAAVALLIVSRVYVVRNVIIQGQTTYSDQEIMRMAKVEFGTSIFRIDSERIRQNLQAGGRAKLVSCEVRKPDTLLLEIRERKRDGIVFSGGQYLVIDREGYVLEITDDPASVRAAYITGIAPGAYQLGGRVTGEQEKLQALTAFCDAAELTGAADYIADVDLTDLRSITGTSTTGVRLRFGDSENLTDKLRWIAPTLSDIEQRGETGGELDVSTGKSADYRPQGA